MSYNDIRMPSFDITGKVAVVTGSGKGIGRAIALVLANNGADIVVCSRTKEQCDKTVSEIESLGRRAIAVVADISRREGADELISQAVKAFGKVDILVNNAGYSGEPKPFHELKDQQWDQTIETNLNGLFYCCQAAVEVMKKNGGGKIINISSMSGATGNPRLPAYAASKGGAVGFTKSLASDLAEFGITVNVVCPGTVLTDITKGALMNETIREKMLKHFPLGRLGFESEIAGPVAFLASDCCRFVTGAEILVDGGFMTENPY